ncbi:MAG: PilZ domain-containing protein [Methylovulum sp.]|nr:PilZ domain-containing protein [Methylovulum sp.]
MSDLKHPQNATDTLITDSETDAIKNSRVATRVIREDINAAIDISNLFGFGKTLSVNVLDITSKGVLVATGEKLGINKKVTLNLRFKSGKVFNIKATVARHSGADNTEYGLKFASLNNELGDYLVESQEKLIFR